MRAPFARTVLFAALVASVACATGAGAVPRPRAREAPAAADALFRHVPDCGLPDLGLTYGGAWADYDGDGLTDLFLSRHGNDDAELYLNRGGLVFAPAEGHPPFPTGLLDHHGTSACDYDADGDWDLYLSAGADRGRGQGFKQLWRCDGPLAFANVVPADHLLADPPGRGRGALWFDLDGDPHPELLLLNYRSPARLFRYDGRDWSELAGQLASEPDSAGASPGAGPQAPWCGTAAAGDLDGDGRQDLVTAGDRLRLYLNEGGRLVDRSDEAGLPRTYPLVADIVLGDADGDLDEDVLLVMRGGALWLYVNASRPGEPALTGPRAYPDLPAPTGSVAGTLADLDNDGDLDIAVVRRTERGIGAEMVRNDGADGFRRVPADASGLHRLPSPAHEIWALDLDRDGDLDLVSLNGSGQERSLNGATAVYENRSAARGLSLTLEPRSGPVHALGARVLLTGAGSPQARQVRNVVAPHNGSTPPLHFGVGAAAGPFTARIDWPSGTRQEVVLPEPGAWILREDETAPRRLPPATAPPR